MALVLEFANRMLEVMDAVGWSWFLHECRHVGRELGIRKGLVLHSVISDGTRQEEFPRGLGTGTAIGGRCLGLGQFHCRRNVTSHIGGRRYPGSIHLAAWLQKAVKLVDHFGIVSLVVVPPMTEVGDFDRIHRRKDCFRRFR